MTREQIISTVTSQVPDILNSKPLTKAIRAVIERTINYSMASVRVRARNWIKENTDTTYYIDDDIDVRYDSERLANDFINAMNKEEQ